MKKTIAAILFLSTLVFWVKKVRAPKGTDSLVQGKIEKKSSKGQKIPAIVAQAVTSDSGRAPSQENVYEAPFTEEEMKIAWEKTQTLFKEYDLLDLEKVRKEKTLILVELTIDPKFKPFSEFHDFRDRRPKFPERSAEFEKKIDFLDSEFQIIKYSKFGLRLSGHFTFENQPVILNTFIDRGGTFGPPELGEGGFPRLNSPASTIYVQVGETLFRSASSHLFIQKSDSSLWITHLIAECKPQGFAFPKSIAIKVPKDLDDSSEVQILWNKADSWITYDQFGSWKKDTNDGAQEKLGTKESINCRDLY